MKIQVKKEHIENGQAGSNHCCPIALAFQEQFGEESNPCVYSFAVDIAKDNKTVSLMLPMTARIFIERFDEGFPVEPFDFELNEGE